MIAVTKYSLMIQNYYKIWKRCKVMSSVGSLSRSHYIYSVLVIPKGLNVVIILLKTNYSLNVAIVRNKLCYNNYPYANIELIYVKFSLHL